MPRIENYMVYGNALPAFQCKDDEVMLHGSVNTGKTLCNFMRAHLFAQKYPGARILFVRKAFSTGQGNLKTGSTPKNAKT